jgi:hypothetical protein
MPVKIDIDASGIVKLTFYAVNSDQHEKLLGRGSMALSELKKNKWTMGFGAKYLLNEDNKLWIDNTITFVALVSF